uniref:Eukaryotic translation initiation factor 4E nuclear import factor 1 n=1 Tax=Scleropages formosus TaxID=113540 RepID=A0A8C9SSS4_SCLFO
MASPYRYTKEKLLEIKELPCSNERPECLSEKYDSDGVWDPEKWHASLYSSSERASPVDGYKKDYSDDRVPLKRRFADPRERLKEDDLDVVLSPQRRSFGGGCQGNAVPAHQSRQAVSPLENKENESLRLVGARRIGSGRIMAARAFERDARADKDVRERERDFKDKRFRRDFSDKRVFSERRRNESYTEEEPEWFSGGPTSQSETIELIGFDDKVLQEDKPRPKRSRKRSESVKEAVECNGDLVEDVELDKEPGVDRVAMQSEVQAEPATGDFDFNEFFNLEKTMPGLASMIEDVLSEGSVSASRFSRWFSSNASPSGSRSSSLRSTPHEELERLAGLEPQSTSSSHGLASYFTPIQSVEKKEKVDILELLQKAKIDLKPLLSSLSVNKERLRESTNSGVVLSLEEVEVGLKALKVDASAGVEKQQLEQKQCQHGTGTPFMAEHLEEALTGQTSVNTHPRDADMSAFNKLVSSMKASGTLPTQPKVNVSVLQWFSGILFQELLGPQGPPRGTSPTLLSNLLGSADPGSSLLRQGAPSPSLYPRRTPSPDYYPGRVQPSTGFVVGPQPLLPEPFTELHRPLSPGPTTQQVSVYMFVKVDVFCEQLSPSFTPTSVIRKMYESKEKSRDEPSSRPESKENVLLSSTTPDSFLEGAEDRSSPATGGKPTFPRSACSTPLSGQARNSKDPERSHQNTSGHHTPTVVSPGPASPFPRPVYQVPLLSHVPLVRPPPPQLHPSVVQRMLAQGLQPQQLPPALLQAGVFPQGVDLSQVQGLPPGLLGQPFYTVGAAGHPLLPRAGNPMQLAVLQQQLQQQRAVPGAPHLPSSVSQSHGMQRTAHSQRRGGSPPLGLAKWFGTDVLQQPLPSMPAKVISVDELEFRQ